MCLKLLLFCSLLAISVSSMGRVRPNYLVETIRNYRQTQNQIQQQQQNVQDLLVPHIEVLQLAEILLKFKGEVASRTQMLINDNYDLIRSVYYTLMSRASTLHNFTLTGIRILRGILEYALHSLQQWPNVPAPSQEEATNQPTEGLNFF